LFPIITQPHKAGPVLRWLVKLMEQRYELMAQLGVRSIFDYKKCVRKKSKQDELPFIVVIIDELADLMMVARKKWKMQLPVLPKWHARLEYI
jgi:S-DNA-T family DNA segregation ATPase FtsK/SpoIIIE